MRATVKDVAALAGVSPKTVSNVINGVIYVRPETLERVERALAELDYVPNLSARALRNGRSGVIALSLADLSTPYSAEMTHAFVEVGHERGWSIQIEETATQPQRERTLVNRARAHLVDGLILNPVNRAESAVDDAIALPPLVVIGEIEQSIADQVWVDSVTAAYEMTSHLISVGYRRIAAVGTPGDRFTSTAGLRRDGYRAALSAAGIPHDPTLEIGFEDWTAEAAAHAVAERLDRGEQADAYFCFTDTMALGVIGELWNRGMLVPQHVGVAGFDDLLEGQHSAPPLTTVSFDKRLYAERTFDLLAARIAAPQQEPTKLTIAHSIIARASTARPSTSV